MRHWEVLDRQIRKGFDIVIDTAYEDIHPRELFDNDCHDIDEICRKIDEGTYDWFMVRVRAMVDGIEMSSSYLGGCLYEDRKDFLAEEAMVDEADVTAEMNMSDEGMQEEALNESFIRMQKIAGIIK